jgi:hypothetical protein
MVVREVLGSTCASAILAVALVVPFVAGAHAQTSTAPAVGEQAKPAGPPLDEVFKGVHLGMSADEVRGLLGKPSEKDETQDVFVLSDDRRMRVYYGADARATAVVSTYIGNSTAAPAPELILGGPAQQTADGSASGMVRHVDEGYWISYSKVSGDPPMVLVTIQKL